MMIMRFVIGALVCLGAGGMSAALADPVTPPAAPAATSAPASSTEPKQAAPAPAAPAADAKAATPAADTKSTVLVQGKAEEDALEKHFLSEGYKIEMHNGEKLFCRREDQLGSRLGGYKNCGTAQQLNFTEQAAKAAVQRGQSQQNNPSTH
jgi:opacity protein-like surface antigen